MSLAHIEISGPPITRTITISKINDSSVLRSDFQHKICPRCSLYPQCSQLKVIDRHTLQAQVPGGEITPPCTERFTTRINISIDSQWLSRQIING